jgi:hypothetical protein
MLGVLCAAVLLAACATGGYTSGEVAQDGPHGAATKTPGMIEHFEVLSTVDAFNGATPPLAAGPYEVITGIVHGRLLKSAPENMAVVDLNNAPADPDDYVAYSTDVVILRPKNASDARRVLYYEVVNRGNKLALSTLIGGTSLLTGHPPDAGLPSLLQMGYTIVWSGWQGDIQQTGNGALAPVGVRFPVANQHDGSPITGLSREEYIPDAQGGPAHTFRLTYPPAALMDRSEVRFTARESWNDAKGREDYDAPSVPVARWHYVTGADGSVVVDFTPPATLPGPHGTKVVPDAGTIYNFIYRAKNPVVNGIGFAAVRDLVTFLRYADKDGRGAPNPLADLKHAQCASDEQCPAKNSSNLDIVIGQGTSQSGRFLRDFLYQGFNRAVNGRKVFDGLIAVVPGARRTWTNVRFSQIGRWSKEHEDHFMPGDQFPFAYNVIRDPVTGATDGLMKRCLATASCPKIMQLDGSYEWWGGRASLVVTDGAGHDLPLPDNVRYYMVAGTQHGGAQGVTSGMATLPDPGSQCQLPASPVALAPVLRALVPAMERWLVSNTPPPPSRYPTVSSGTLVKPEQLDFPSLTEVIVPSGPSGSPVHLSFTYTGVHNQLFVTDYTRSAPVVRLSSQYRVLVPQVDANGNETSGVLVPDVQVPLATYTGWNVRTAGHALGEACGASGAAIPFAIDAAAKSPGHDTRAALADLYTGRADYQAKVAAAARHLVDEGYLLPRDAENVFIENSKKVSPRLLPAP